MDDSNESLARDQILALMYVLKQMGVDSISTADLLILLGNDPDKISESDYDSMLSLPDTSDAVAELCFARITNQIH